MTIKDNILTADSGKVLTNGEAFGKTVRLGRCGKAENWHEITEEQYEQIMKEQEEQYETES